MKPDFSSFKFKNSIWHSAAAVLVVLAVSVMLILGVKALTSQSADGGDDTASVMQSALDAEISKAESEIASQGEVSQ